MFYVVVRYVMHFCSKAEHSIDCCGYLFKSTECIMTNVLLNNIFANESDFLSELEKHIDCVNFTSNSVSISILKHSELVKHLKIFNVKNNQVRVEKALFLNENEEIVCKILFKNN